MLGPPQRLPRLSAAPVPPRGARHRTGPAEPLTAMPGLSIHHLSSTLPLRNVYSLSPVLSPSDIFMVAIGTNETQIKKEKGETDRGKAALML